MQNIHSEIPNLKKVLRAKMLLEPDYIPDNLAEYTSDEQITGYLGGNVQIQTYSELEDDASLDELIPNKTGTCILLIETEPNSGHWVALLKYGNVVEFFNSYGDAPGHEVALIPTEMNEELDQSSRDILDILDREYQRGKEVIYNKAKLQKISRDIGTCGKHCVLRGLMLKYYGMGLGQYLKFIRHMCSLLGVDADGLVTLLIDVD